MSSDAPTQLPSAPIQSSTVPTVAPVGKVSAGALLWGFFVVGIIGFGGGSALIPVVQTQIVDKLKAFRESQYNRHVIVANITPGALPVKLGASAGLTVGGWWLSVLTALAVTLPGAGGTIALLALADYLGPTAIQAITYASVGIAVFIIVLLLGYIIRVHAKAGSRLWAYVVITILSALATGGPVLVKFFGILFGAQWDVQLPRLNALSLILVALAIIVLASIPQLRRGGDKTGAKSTAKGGLKASLQAAGAFVVLAAIGVGIFAALSGATGASLGTLLGASAVSSFGGGEAYVGVADGYFVSPGLVDKQAFYTQLIPIANALPGPILVKVAAGIGYLSGAKLGVGAALALGVAAMLVTVGACSAVAMPVLGAYEKLKNHPIIVNIGRYILPVICGLLIAVSATMMDVSAEVVEAAGVNATLVTWISLAAIGVGTWLHLRKLVPDLVMLGVCGAISLGVLLAV